MRKGRVDPLVLDHLEWIGFVRPTGLVVSAPALVRAGAILERRDAEGQKKLQALLEEKGAPDFRSFAQDILDWSFSPKAYCGTEENPIPDDVEIHVPELGISIRPDFAVRELEPKEGASPYQLVVLTIPANEDFDKQIGGKGRAEISAQGRIERLLRGIGVSAGLLYNGRALRLVSAPRGESSGWLDFQMKDMILTAGRPICTAVRLLLSQTRLLALPKNKRLTALLEESRKYQNEVSERLAEQVLHALYEFLRGFQAAHDASKGKLLAEVLTRDPDIVYRALLTVLLRLVFLLYAEERDMLPEDETFLRYYSLAGLYERLREDAALYPDTMDQRYGAWPQLLVLFRMIYDGAEYVGVSLPSRHGDLFDPDRFPFLEGRSGPREGNERFEAPLVPDGTVYRALEKLLVLDGERLSYRALDVEQIGSVYETMMGFRIETASGRSVAIRAEKKHGAPTTIDLESLLMEAPAKREKWLQDHAGRKLSDSVRKAIKEASTLTELHAALDKVIDKQATPDIVPAGSLILQPSEERRRSGSHYTPRSLTEPIVRTTLEPILAGLNATNSQSSSSESQDTRLSAPDFPTPEQILALKVCDPAMGSGAFLVETCRQLAEVLIESWRGHGPKPAIPTDEDEVIYARRLIAQRCLYGVDRNPMAVDLAKVSLWLATLAKGHAFTFLDHALRHGDSLVGLTNEEILAVHWDEKAPKTLFDETLPDRIRHASTVRQKIAANDEGSYDELAGELANASGYIEDLRLVGDSVIAAFFAASKPRDRLVKRSEVLEQAKGLFESRDFGAHSAFRERLSVWSDWLRSGERQLPPFHWQLEFPEIFLRPNPGFDAFVGNPPFSGKNTLEASNPEHYLDWLLSLHEESHGNSDLVAHFFRGAFNLLRASGTFGLVATNTIGQGDTRSTGLRWICEHGGEIYSARKRLKWPGLAAVVVSVVNVTKGTFTGIKFMDGRMADRITAFLVDRGESEAPYLLQADTNKSFIGSYLLGMGFTFDDEDAKGVASPIATMRCLISENPCNQEVIFPYIGGEDLNQGPAQANHRYVINFRELPEQTCRDRYPALMAIVEEKVKPERMSQNDQRAKDRWWQFIRSRPELQAAVEGLDRILGASIHSPHFSLAFLPKNAVFSHALVLFPLDTFACFAGLQARPHGIWAQFFGSSLEDRLRYTPSDCFETFPFPPNWENDPALEEVGKRYYEFRGDLMARHNEGLTKTYNRFHDPEERDPEILKLRELHADMDRAVLDAYGWTDIPTDCEFILDYEEEDEDSNSRRKKPWRYRWPDGVRDEVLARLLELNAQRAREEERVGLTKKKSKKAVDARGFPEMMEEVVDSGTQNLP